jgi:glyoxylase-like metal-dependent hydrolase (beta-lactamase superfamily II)
VSVLQTNVVPRVHRLGSPFVNWYVVEDGNRLTAVDAGLPGFATDLERDLHELGHRPEAVEAVVLTHSDADHTGMAKALREAGAVIYIHGYDQGTLASPGPKGGDARPQRVVPHLRYPQAWRTMVGMVRGGGARPAALEGPEIVSDGDELDIPGRPRVVHTPGHTPGHCAFVFDDRAALFAGDAVCTWNPLTGRRGPQLLPRPLNVSNAEAQESVQRIGGLAAKVTLPGHGEPWHGAPATLAQRALDAA